MIVPTICKGLSGEKDSNEFPSASENWIGRLSILCIGEIEESIKAKVSSI